MNLYLISQSENNDYDTYDSAVVAAESEQDAKQIHPGFEEWSDITDFNSSWASSPETVEATLIGLAKDGTEEGIIVESFNAG